MERTHRTSTRERFENRNCSDMMVTYCCYAVVAVLVAVWSAKTSHAQLASLKRVCIHVYVVHNKGFNTIVHANDHAT